MENSIIIPHFYPFSISQCFQICKIWFIRVKVHSALKTELDTTCSEKKWGKGEIETTQKMWKSQYTSCIPGTPNPHKQYSVSISITLCHKPYGVQTHRTQNGKKKHQFTCSNSKNIWVDLSIPLVTITFESFSSFRLNQKNYLSSTEVILMFLMLDFTMTLFGSETEGNLHFQSQYGEHKRWGFSPNTSTRDHMWKCE